MAPRYRLAAFLLLTARLLTISLLTALLGCTGSVTNSDLPEGDRPDGDLPDKTLSVFAAASLRDALTEAAADWPGPERLEFNFAGSNVLSRQLQARPSAADVIISAHPRWLDELEAENVLRSGSRRALLSNRLVVVAHRDAPWRLAHLDDLAQLDFDFLAIGHPDAVPAGIYAREALQAVESPESSQDSSDSLWQAVEPRLLPTADVRAALAHVAAQPRILGIVYRTDANAATRSGAPVRVLLEVPAELTPNIRYDAAVTAASRQPESALAFLDFLSRDASGRGAASGQGSASGRAGPPILRAHGFEVLAP